MAGKVGRSGRRSLTDEAERARVRQLAWTTTGHYLDSKGKLKDRAQIAVGVVKADMAKPIVIDQSSHTHEHKTYIKFDEMKQTELIDFLLGRNGHPAKSN